MLDEKLLKRIKTMNQNFIDLGFDLEEDIIELLEQKEDIREKIRQLLSIPNKRLEISGEFDSKKIP